MVLFPPTEAVGAGATFTVVLVEFVQPLELVTVTVYEVGVVGLTVMAAEVDPVFHA